MLGNLRGALAGTTVLMVASRPSTIALADEVVYLERGTVVDHGPHAELMARQRRLPRAGRGVRDRSRERRRRRRRSPRRGAAAVTEPIGRFSAPPTRSAAACEEAPVLRQGLGVTWLLAAVGAGGRVVVPILLQQAIDQGIVGDDGVRRRLRRRAGADRRRRPGRSPASPSARRSCGSARAASRRCTTCGRG